MRRPSIIWAIPIAFVFTCCSNEDGTDAGATPVTRTVEAERPDTAIPDSHVADRGSSGDEYQLIVPGERIGQTRIDVSLEVVNAEIGAADSGEAGMGHVIQHRRITGPDGKEYTLDIYATLDERASGHDVIHIRTTSPSYYTRGGMSVGNRFNAIAAAFLDMEPIAEYNEDGRRVLVYDQPALGIAFEFAVGDNGKPAVCTAISVHEPGRDILHAYASKQGFKEIVPQLSANN